MNQETTHSPTKPVRHGGAEEKLLVFTPTGEVMHGSSSLHRLQADTSLPESRGSAAASWIGHASAHGSRVAAATDLKREANHSPGTLETSARPSGGALEYLPPPSAVRAAL